MVRGKRTPAPQPQPTARSSEGSSLPPPRQPASSGERTAQDDSSSEEDFDLDDLNASVSEEESDDNATPPPPSRASEEPTASKTARSSTAPANGGQASSDLVTPPPSNPSRRAEDIAYYFDKSDGKSAICKVCRQGSVGFGYTYSAKTSTSILRTHLDKHHRKEYLRLCEEKGWKNQLQSSKNGGAGVNSETPQASQSQRRTQFTQEGFLEHLVKFIVATNQSVHIVESPEFRELLLYLRPGLQIPSASDLSKLMPKKNTARNA